MSYIVPQDQTNILVQHEEAEALKVYDEMVGRAGSLHRHAENIPGPLCLEIVKVKHTDSGIRVEPTPEYHRIQEELRQGREAIEKLKQVPVNKNGCLMFAGNTVYISGTIEPIEVVLYEVIVETGRTIGDSDGDVQIVVGGDVTYVKADSLYPTKESCLASINPSTPTPDVPEGGE